MSNMEELIRQTVENTTGVNSIAKSVQTLAGNGAALDRDVFVLSSMLLNSPQKTIGLTEEMLVQYRGGDRVTTSATTGRSSPPARYTRGRTVGTGGTSQWAAT